MSYTRKLFNLQKVIADGGNPPRWRNEVETWQHLGRVESAIETSLSFTRKLLV